MTEKRDCKNNQPSNGVWTFSLKDWVKILVIKIKLLPCREESFEVDQASGHDDFWMSLWKGVTGRVNWEETQTPKTCWQNYIAHWPQNATAFP